MVYEKIDRYWKPLTLLPLILLVASSAIIVNNLLTKGSFLERDVELTGGKTIILSVSNDVDAEKVSKVVPGTVHVTRGAGTSLLIEIGADEDESKIIEAVKKEVVVYGSPTVRTVGPALGEIFWKQTQLAIMVAFVSMAIIVFLLFRNLVPSSIVILAAVTDIMVTIVVVDILGIKLSLPVLAALLMIIGYSVDTDILLTSTLLKTGKKDVKEKIDNAMKTGLTMSLTAVAALSMLYIISGSYILEQMAIVLIVGILVDIPATWLANAGLLRLWIERKGQ